jgi:hypothetical protein
MLTPKLLIIAWLAHVIVIHAYAQEVLSTNTSENPISDIIPKPLMNEHIFHR